MKLVVETNPDVDPESDSGLGHLLRQASLTAAGKDVFDEHSLHYYESKSSVNADEIIKNLTKNPLIKAAYFKPDSTPPAP